MTSRCERAVLYVRDRSRTGLLLMARSCSFCTSTYTCMGPGNGLTTHTSRQACKTSAVSGRKMSIARPTFIREKPVLFMCLSVVSQWKSFGWLCSLKFFSSASWILRSVAQ